MGEKGTRLDKEEVRRHSDIVEVIGGYVDLKAKGPGMKDYWGRCPFHEEDTASFHVWPEKGIYKCFGCGEGGDVFKFLVKHLGIEFGEAVQMLARRAGLDVGTGRDGDRRTGKNTDGNGRARTDTDGNGRARTDTDGNGPTRTDRDGQTDGLTVEALAEAKGFTVGYLRDLGVFGMEVKGKAAVGIRYFLGDGSEAPRGRCRTALRAGDGSWWTGPRTEQIVPYGLDRLPSARERGWIWLVEGESDCWSLWAAGMPALGIPGASMAGKLALEHLEGIGKVFVSQEPDEGGKPFVEGVSRRLDEIGWVGMGFTVKF